MISLRLTVSVCACPKKTEFPLVRILDCLNTEEYIRTNHRDHDVDNRTQMLLELAATNRPSHGQAAKKQDQSVQSSKPFIEMDMSRFKNFRIMIPVNDVSHK